MKKWSIFLLDCLLFCSLWFIGFKVFVRYFHNYAVQLFAQGNLPIPQTLIIPFVVTLISSCIFLLLRPLYSRELKKSSLITIYAVYTLALIFGLFMKNVGQSGVNLSIEASIQDLYYDRITVFLNLIMFIPMGLAFKPRLRNSLLFLLFILGVEYSQYYFALGFFDIGDIIANSLSFFAGNLMGASFIGAYIKEQIT